MANPFTPTEAAATANQERTPRWLKRIQQHSWEPEILLSGFILIGLLQLPALIEETSIYLRAETLRGNMAGLFTGATFAVYLLIAGLIIHLFLRSVWVGFIGLSYTFPKGIQVDKLQYQPRYTAIVQRIPSIKEQILKLEKVCSSIFATCFFLIMVILGVLLGSALFFISCLALEILLNKLFQVSLFAFIDPHFDKFLGVIILIYAVDFVLLGIYRRYSLSARLFYPLYKLGSWLTFAKVYRSIYYLYISNISRRYLALFFMFFVLLNIFGQPILRRSPDNRWLSLIDFYHSDKGDGYLFSGYFRDRNHKWSSALLSIPSPVVSGRYLEVGLMHLLQHEGSMYTLCKLDAATLKQDPAAAEKRLRCVTDYYRLYIDDIAIPEPEWMYHYFQESGRKGFIAFIDVNELTAGRHTLAIYAGNNIEHPMVRTYFFKA
jgi:hypothetical protein